MNLKTIYILLLSILISCSGTDKELKAYGYVRHDFEKYNGFTGVSLNIDSFENYGALVEDIYARSCDNLSPYIEIENDSYMGGVFPLLMCDPPPWRSLERNTFYISKLGIYKNNVLIEPDDLEALVIKNYLNNGESPNFAENASKVMFIFEFPKETELNVIVDKLIQITNIYDKTKNTGGLGIILGLQREFITPLPQ